MSNDLLPFDPVAKIPKKLRSRFERWQKSPPKLQFSQYGPLTTYFSFRFPNAMVKPQGLLRDLADVGDVEELGQETHSRPRNRPRLSTDSNGATVDKKAKSYPDFIIASYYGEDERGETQPDVIRMIVEVTSLGENLAPPESVRQHGVRQIQRYAVMLGLSRLSPRCLGVLILGTEVLFCRPRKLKGGDRTIWTTDANWRSLYGEPWDKEMAQIAKIIEEDTQPGV